MEHFSVWPDSELHISVSYHKLPVLMTHSESGTVDAYEQELRAKVEG